MVIVKNLFPILILSFLYSCGKSSRGKEVKVFLSRQNSSGVPTYYLNKSPLISNLKRHQLILDTDQDGFLDKDDFDIDNDNIPNDCDIAPFNKSIGNSDHDLDGIPDFCDLNPRSDLSDDNVIAHFQSKILKEKGIIFLEDDLSYAEEDLPLLTKLLNDISLKVNFPNQKLLTIALTSHLSLGEYGVYDGDWANIRFTKDDSYSEMVPEVKLWNWVLTHELFHFVGHSNSELYNQFHQTYVERLEKGTLSFPTEYAQMSEDEYFAELFTAQYYGVEVDF